MKFDYVIMNPPYGKSGSLGNKITWAVKNNLVVRRGIINLMPSAGYSTDDLYKYVASCSEKIHWEDEAQTDPCIAYITNEKNNMASFFEFEIEYIYAKWAQKFFRQQLVRPDVCQKHSYCKNASDTHLAGVTSATTFVTGIWVTHDGVHGLLNAPSEKVWNIDKVNERLVDVFTPRKGKQNTSITVTFFNSEVEKTNFANWWYSAELSGRPPKAGLASKLLFALNTTTSRPYSNCIPKVDWTHPWTDEEILRDYGYTEEEINEI